MKKYTRYLITFLVGVVIAALVCLYKDLFHTEDTAQIVSILSDACFTSGVLIGASGMLVLISNEGNFDTLGYGVKIIKNMWKKPEERKIEKNLFEYKMAKNDKKRISTVHLIVIGAVYFLLAAVYTIIFYRIS